MHTQSRCWPSNRSTFTCRLARSQAGERASERERGRRFGKLQQSRCVPVRQARIFRIDNVITVHSGGLSCSPVHWPAQPSAAVRAQRTVQQTLGWPSVRQRCGRVECTNLRGIVSANRAQLALRRIVKRESEKKNTLAIPGPLSALRCSAYGHA